MTKRRKKDRREPKPPGRVLSFLQGLPVVGGLFRWYGRHRARAWVTILFVAHVAGALTSVKAIMDTRTSQGAIAWAISLNTAPLVAVPSYWIFGRSEFQGYVLARREEVLKTNPRAQQLKRDLEAFKPPADSYLKGDFLLEKVAKLPYTGGNDAELLIDGKATFDAILKAIDAAEDYILFQFYIVKADGLGNEVKDRLLARAADGVRVFFLYDEIGSYKLPKSYLKELRDGGVLVSAFHSTKGEANRFQLNFRNHRKIVVIDGKTAFVGGHNVGDEYLGKSPKPLLSPWRDTHMQLWGPVVQTLQIPFLEDWHWATESLIEDLNWKPQAAPSGKNMEAIAIPSGPADPFETCTHFFLEMINRSEERLWIASPYFVPDEQIVSALQAAALRGVDVRILLPNNPDHKLVYLSSFSYLVPAEKAGVKIYRYTPGFLHEKVVLVDDDTAAVGTANLDNRSFRLNFEIMVLVENTEFAGHVREMFEADFEKSRLAAAGDYTDASFFFKLSVKVARLTAPIQ